MLVLSHPQCVIADGILASWDVGNSDFQLHRKGVFFWLKPPVRPVPAHADPWVEQADFKRLEQWFKTLVIFVIFVGYGPLPVTVGNEGL